MGNHPILTFFLAILIANFISKILHLPFRAITLWKHGYPPLHCDVDGDLKKEQSE
jgi:hypothetical protein